ncbi:hypothetical protein [Streptomyces gobiensis]|uniref:hypothetical protein n=1 Tax=Streptomyces gobiensis TaxID=2875706 RepID=UPI001E2FCB0A|nr:hypothetical protein [Streptomyces gobiensis]UGY91684.1 hypothetical protein test1122_08065 [Streptomyces gobiensis]
MLELIGVSRHIAQLQETEEGTPVVVFQPLDRAAVRVIASTLTQGCMNGAPQLGVAMWSDGMRCVGEVMGRSGHSVRLRSLADGREWRGSPGDLRIAQVQEVHAALTARPKSSVTQ